MKECQYCRSIVHPLACPENSGSAEEWSKGYLSDNLPSNSHESFILGFNCGQNDLTGKWILILKYGKHKFYKLDENILKLADVFVEHKALLSSRPSDDILNKISDEFTFLYPEKLYKPCHKCNMINHNPECPNEYDSLIKWSEGFNSQDPPSPLSHISFIHGYNYAEKHWEKLKLPYTIKWEGSGFPPSKDVDLIMKLKLIKIFVKNGIVVEQKPSNDFMKKISNKWSLYPCKNRII